MALGDCSFVKVPGGAVVPAIYTLFPSITKDMQQSDATTTTTDTLPLLGMGFYTFERANQNCYWYTDKTLDNESIFGTYKELLGNDWNAARAIGSATPLLAFLIWVYMLSYTCSAQPRIFRYATSFALSIVLVILQGLTFMVNGSSWCSNYSCEFSRSGGFSVGATVCFFLSGLCFFYTSDYPGNQRGAGDVVDKDEEQPEAAVDDAEKSAEGEGGVNDVDDDSEAGQEVSLDGSLYVEEEDYKR